MREINRSFDELSEVELIELIGGNDLEKAVGATASVAATPIVLQFAVLDKDRHIRLTALRNKNISDNLVLALCDDMDAEILSEAKTEAERRGVF